MRGEVLHYDEAQGFGFISGADGNRYTFGHEDLRRQFPIAKGVQVEFQANGARAGSVLAVVGDTPVAATLLAGAAPRPATTVQHFGRYAVADAPAGLWNYFWKSVTTGYADFRGRARRKEYWGFALFFVLVLIGLTFVGIIIDAATRDTSSTDFLPVSTFILTGFFSLAMIIPYLSVSVRRQHDIGLSGWFILVGILPTIGNLVLLVFALIPSQAHENKWGPVPLGVAAA